jgi:ligand-binding SRPBCC domain-containing protein
MEHTFADSLELPLPRETVFAFFSDAHNLEAITPAELDFRILTPDPIVLETGALIEYRLRLFGVPFRWVTRIAEWSPPERFVDEQLRGPYALWVHTHTFEPTPSGTLISDRVRYQLPLSPLGEVAYPIVRAQVGRIFEHRRRVVREALLGRGIVAHSA